MRGEESARSGPSPTKIPNVRAPSASVPPPNSATSVGTTGITMPSAIESASSVAKMKPSPAEREGREFATVRRQARSPSITHTRAGVGTMRVRRKPDAAKSSRNSASERCRPPVQTSMFTSLAAAPRLSSERSMRAG